jgi:hypothetical protein
MELQHSLHNAEVPYVHLRPSTSCVCCVLCGCADRAGHPLCALVLRSGVTPPPGA